VNCWLVDGAEGGQTYSAFGDIFYLIMKFGASCVKALVAVKFF